MTDHVGVGELRMELLKRVQAITGEALDGPIRVLTPLRQFGFYFSPICLYYCWDGDELHSVLAEVCNTPWRERHWYVLSKHNRLEGNGLRFKHSKEFHVSPFMDMESTYAWQIDEPGDRLKVQMQVDRHGELIFTAEMKLARKQLTDLALAYSLIRFPIASLQMLAAIYFEALRLWQKKCPFYVHPSKRPPKPDAVTA